MVLPTPPSPRRPKMAPVPPWVSAERRACRSSSRPVKSAGGTGSWWREGRVELIAAAGLGGVEELEPLRTMSRISFAIFASLCVPAISLEIRQRFAVLGTSLEPGEPRKRVPDAGLYDHREEGHPFLLAAVQQMGDLLVADEFRFQGGGGDQEDGHPGGIHRALDLLEPFVARADVPVVPGLKEALYFEDAEVFEEAVFPVLVLVAVGDEDGWGHFVEL